MRKRHSRIINNFADVFTFMGPFLVFMILNSMQWNFILVATIPIIFWIVLSLFFRYLKKRDPINFLFHHFK